MSHGSPSSSGQPRPYRVTLVEARRILLWVVFGLTALLALSGLWLTFAYRPSLAQPWNEAREASSGWVRLTHRLASVILVPVLVALLVVCLPVARRWVPAVALVLLALALSFTGYLLPWDQLALWAVKVGGHVDGAWHAAFSDEVRFILIGGTEVTQGTYRLWLLVHTGGLAVAFAAVLAVLVRLRR